MVQRPHLLLLYLCVNVLVWLNSDVLVAIFKLTLHGYDGIKSRTGYQKPLDTTN